MSAGRNASSRRDGQSGTMLYRHAASYDVPHGSTGLRSLDDAGLFGAGTSRSTVCFGRLRLLPDVHGADAATNVLSPGLLPANCRAAGGVHDHAAGSRATK